MKKAVLILLAAGLLCVLFCFPVKAAGMEEEESWYGDLWESVDDDTRSLLDRLGIEGISAQSFLTLSPDRIFSLIVELISGEAVSPLRYAAAAVLSVIITSFACSFLSENGAMRSRCETLGHLCVMFTLLCGIGRALREGMPAVGATEDFMIMLVPVLTGIMGFSGSPALALSWGGAVLAFSETVTAFFSAYIPAAAALGTAACAAANLNAGTDFSGAAKTVAKAVTVAMGFVAGVFTAVLTVKDVIASAADSVSVKSAKMIVGQSVPIVGGAVADALNAVAAGLSLVKNTAAVFGVIVLFLIVLVPVLRLLLWKFTFCFIGASAGLLGRKQVAELTDSLNGLLSVILAVICFNSAVFIVAVALVTGMKGGA